MGPTPDMLKGVVHCQGWVVGVIHRIRHGYTWEHIGGSSHTGDTHRRRCGILGNIWNLNSNWYLAPQNSARLGSGQLHMSCTGAGAVL